jgi:hypothetical protein
LPRAQPTDAIIHDIADDDEDDNIEFIPYDAEKRTLLASFESLLGDADRCQWRKLARSDALAMRRGYLCSDLRGRAEGTEARVGR